MLYPHARMDDETALLTFVHKSAIQEEARLAIVIDDRDVSLIR